MQTEAQICNVALLRVGQRQTLDSLTESSTEAQACAALYPPARDAVLAGWAWPFATRHATLALLDETRSGHLYTYALPADCLVARYLFTGARPGMGALASSVYSDVYGPITTVSQLPAINGRIPAAEFVIEAKADGSGRVLLTDWPDAKLVYTAALTDVRAFPPLVADAIAWRLAADLALSLVDRPQVAFGIDQKAEAALRKAQAQAANEAQPDPRPDSSFISVRG